MAVTFTLRDDTVVNAPGGTSFATNSLTVTSGKKCLIFIDWGVFSGARGTVSTVAGSSITGAALVSGAAGDDTSGTERQECWVADGTGSAGVVTITLAGAGSNISTCSAITVEMDAQDLTTLLAQAANVVAGRLASDWNEMPFDLDPLADAANNATLVYANSAAIGTAWTPPAGFTSIVDSDTTRARLLYVKQGPAAASALVDKGDFNYVHGMALEIKAAGAPPAQPPQPMPYQKRTLYFL